MHPRLIVTGTLLLCAICVTAASSQAQVRQWRIADKPTVSIGRVEGDERYLFSYIEAVVRTANGHILVFDGTATVRIFDRQGRFVSQFGKTGEGPGEFRGLRSLLPYRGDSIAAHDMGLRRISIFDSQGKFGRSIQNPVTTVRVAGTIPAQSCCKVKAALPDGSFIVEPPELLPNMPGGQRHGTLTLIKLSADGSTVDTIAAVKSRRLSYDAGAPNKIRGLHFTVSFEYVSIGDRIYGGNGETNSLQVLSTRGQTLGQLTLRQPRIEITRQVRQAFEDSLRANYARNPRMYERPVEAYLVGDFPELMPYYSFLDTDQGGNLWIGSTPSPASPIAEYRIYSATGTQLGQIRFPPRTYPIWFGRDEIALVHSDENDVQTLRVYPLIH